MELFHLNGGDYVEFKKPGALQWRTDCEEGERIQAAMHKWDSVSAGWVAYLSPTGTNKEVRVLKIMPKPLGMPSRPHFIRYFSKCMGESETQGPHWDYHSPTLLNSPSTWRRCEQ